MFCECDTWKKRALEDWEPFFFVPSSKWGLTLWEVKFIYIYCTDFVWRDLVMCFILWLKDSCSVWTYGDLIFSMVGPGVEFTCWKPRRTWKPACELRSRWAFSGDEIWSGHLNRFHWRPELMTRALLHGTVSPGAKRKWWKCFWAWPSFLAASGYMIM